MPPPVTDALLQEILDQLVLLNKTLGGSVESQSDYGSRIVGTKKRKGRPGPRPTPDPEPDPRPGRGRGVNP